LDQIAKLFVPSVIELLSDESGVLEFYSERSISTIVDGVPLTGKCDLLVCNGATKTIKVYDYKTGSPDNADFGAAYHRQLQFYKLLIENSSEFEGWTVSGGADLFAEPSKKRGGVMLEPKYIEVSEGELTHLRALASAVWHRIQNNQYDCSTFEESAQLAELKASCDPKKPSAAATQAVFEQWLIDEG
ncbi:MAG: PD-(D/E)XK nuclease family protein, partial [Coriobacteriia bacterium]|nr:PD-(D/E)XK nuclease family protein [Coriobacteriia bacterium]